ncbi:MAG: hypothetical protein COA44_07200 [Arcobacter sp.]|nr:MAG: hypothetical protein COA44_07200 [Arcobacter sp.]
METNLDLDEVEERFSRRDEGILVLKENYFIDANEVALKLIGVSSLAIFKSLHPAMISPEFQPDGESSKSKTDRIFAQLQESKVGRFKWQHIKLNGTPFDVEVTLRLNEETEAYVINVHWRSLS